MPDAAEQAVEEALDSLEQGDVARARAAYRRALEQRPDDPSVLVDLGHLALAQGDAGEALDCFGRALAADAGRADALQGLVATHRRNGRPEEALIAARRLAELEPDDPLPALEVADLALALDLLDEAEDVFRSLPPIDEDPEHAVYAFHGLIEIELRRGRPRKALDLAVDATRVDRLGRTTDVLAHVVARVFGEGGRAAPSRDDVDAALAASRAEHRRLHDEETLVV